MMVKIYTITKNRKKTKMEKEVSVIVGWFVKKEMQRRAGIKSFRALHATVRFSKVKEL